MIAFFTLFAIISGFTIPFFGIALFWARKSASPKIAGFLKISALAWATILLAAYSFVSAAYALCDGGNALYGYSNCHIISAEVANLSLLVYLAPTGFAAVYTAISFFVCGVCEWRLRSTPRNSRED